MIYNASSVSGCSEYEYGDSDCISKKNYRIIYVGPNYEKLQTLDSEYTVTFPYGNCIYYQ